MLSGFALTVLMQPAAMSATITENMNIYVGQPTGGSFNLSSQLGGLGYLTSAKITATFTDDYDAPQTSSSFAGWYQTGSGPIRERYGCGFSSCYRTIGSYRDYSGTNYIYNYDSFDQARLSVSGQSGTGESKYFSNSSSTEPYTSYSSYKDQNGWIYGSSYTSKTVTENYGYSGDFQIQMVLNATSLAAMSDAKKIEWLVNSLSGDFRLSSISLDYDLAFRQPAATADAPGPIAGAGIPALLGLGGLAWVRRRRAALSA